VDFDRWAESLGPDAPQVDGVPVTRYWLIPPERRPKVYVPHATMTADEIRRRTQQTWDRFYSLPAIWERSRCMRSTKSRIAFLLISKLYRQMYANTGIATDSARHARATRVARMMAKPCRRLFVAKPMPDLRLADLAH
jgi:hypothetical protein